jgi:hypothetical protein
MALNSPRNGANFFRHSMAKNPYSHTPHIAAFLLIKKTQWGKRRFQTPAPLIQKKPTSVSHFPALFLGNRGLNPNLARKN